MNITSKEYLKLLREDNFPITKGVDQEAPKWVKLSTPKKSFLVRLFNFLCR
jgi:hypothetical protein